MSYLLPLPSSTGSRSSHTVLSLVETVHTCSPRRPDGVSRTFEVHFSTFSRWHIWEKGCGVEGLEEVWVACQGRCRTSRGSVGHLPGLLSHVSRRCGSPARVVVTRLEEGVGRLPGSLSHVVEGILCKTFRQTIYRNEQSRMNRYCIRTKET